MAVCSACEKFAAVSTPSPTKEPLCGDCAILAAKDPADTFAERQTQLKKVRDAKEADKKIAAGTMSAGGAIADYARENARLSAENADLKAKLAGNAKPQVEADRSPTHK